MTRHSIYEGEVEEMETERTDEEILADGMLLGLGFPPFPSPIMIERCALLEKQGYVIHRLTQGEPFRKAKREKVRP